MSDAGQPDINTHQKAPRKLWPWVITSIVAVLAALFLTVWIPQEQGTDLLKRIKEAGGTYSIDRADRPEAGSILEDLEYVELFDRVESLSLAKVDSELFRDCIAAFRSLEWLEFDLHNSIDFDREAALQLTDLELLYVTADENVEQTDYEFLAGCESVEHLLLGSEFHDDGFWQFLPQMKSLTKLELMAGRELRGVGIPDLTTSKLRSIFIQRSGGEGELHNFTLLLTAPHLEELEILGISIIDIPPVTVPGSPSLEKLNLMDAELTDDILPILAQCKSLRQLELASNQIAGESLDPLVSLPLSRLDLTGNPLTEEACRDLAQLASLEVLDLTDCRLQTVWLASWADSPLSSSVTHLDLMYNEIGDEVIDVLMTFSNLQQLRIYRTGISTEAMLKLNQHPSLKTLDDNGQVPHTMPVTREILKRTYSME